jgi:hypothetical protein
MSEYQQVPVAVAEEVSFRYAKDVVVIVCFDTEHNMFHTTTYGNSAEDKLHAWLGSSARNALHLRREGTGGEGVMSDHCQECGKSVVPSECPDVSWDDGEAIYTCAECCESIEIDNFWRDEMRREGEA